MMGPNAKIEPMKSATLRLGGVPKSYEEQMMIVGDAAGFIDPLTGEGIQYAGGSLVVGPSGETVAEAGIEEEVLIADIDPSAVERVRRDFPIV